jgi:hypothetical protein
MFTRKSLVICIYYRLVNPLLRYPTTTQSPLSWPTGLACLCSWNTTRHAKSRHIVTIGRVSIFWLRKDKVWNFVEFVETVSFDSINAHFLHDECEKYWISCNFFNNVADYSVFFQIYVIHFWGNLWKYKFWTQKNLSILNVWIRPQTGFTLGLLVFLILKTFQK